MSTIVHLGRIGIRYTGEVPWQVETMFPPLYARDPDPKPVDKPQHQQTRTPVPPTPTFLAHTPVPTASTPPPPDPLARFGWVVPADDAPLNFLDVVGRTANVELAWREAPPCPLPAYDLDQWSNQAADVDVRIARALSRLHAVGQGQGVKVAVIERAWSALAGGQAYESRVVPESVWVHAVEAFAGHGDRTFAALHGAPGLFGCCPQATIGLFSPLALDPRTGGLHDDLHGAIVRAARWLGIEPIGCATQLMAPLTALLPDLDRIRWPTARGVLLIEMQHFLMEPQVRDLDPDEREHQCPGGRAAAGPVDADPAIRAALAEVTRAGHLVVVPAANGRRDLREVQDDVALASPTLSPRLDSDGHTAFRVGASHLAGRVAGSNYGPGAVELCAPGHAVPTAAVDPETGAWAPARWGGTSAASALIAGIAACLATVHPIPRVRRMLLQGSPVPGIGVCPSFFDDAP